MKTWKDIEKPVQACRIVDSVVCDRCGNNARCSIGIGGSWGAFEGLIQGDGRVNADLCRNCVLSLVAFINDDRGSGVQRGY